MVEEFPMELITGIEQIDLQHMEFISRLKMLHESFLNGTNEQKLVETINYVKCYIIGHFKLEEKMMLDSGYPNYNRHMSEHKKFIEEYAAIEKKFKKSGFSSDLNLDFNVQLINWLNGHIHTEDITMAEFIKQAGGYAKEEDKQYKHG